MQYVIENSDQTPVLKLAGLVSGRYLFRLTVFDLQGASSSDTASLIVKSPKTIIDQVEIMVNADMKSFTQEQEVYMYLKMILLLHFQKFYIIKGATSDIFNIAFFCISRIHY